MKKNIAIILFLSVFALSSGQTVTIKRFSDYEEMRLKKFNKGVEALQQAHEHNLWFNKYAFEGSVWNGYKVRDDFNAVYQRNEEMRAEEQKMAKSIFEVVEPDEFIEGKKYPLFIALHGGSSNIEEFRKSWKSVVMARDFITLYVQSSQVIAMNGYNWTEDMELSKREIAEAFRKVLGDYKIDRKEIIIGGFSSGGVASMEVIFSKTVPASGFIVLSPALPDSFNRELITEAKNDNVRGTIYTAEFDPRLKLQEQMVDTLKSVGFEHQFIVSPGSGHWFPDNFDKMIDDAIEFVRAK